MARPREPQPGDQTVTFELLVQRPQRDQRMPDGLFMLTGLQDQTIPEARATVACQRGHRPFVEELERAEFACISSP